MRRLVPVAGHVYLVRCGDTEYYKIGFTTHTPESRLPALQTGNPLPLRLVDQFYGPTASADETFLHRLLTPYSAGMGGGREWFYLPEHVAEIVHSVFSMPGCIPIAIQQRVTSLDQLGVIFHQCCGADEEKYARELGVARQSLMSDSEWLAWFAANSDSDGDPWEFTAEPWKGYW